MKHAKTCNGCRASVVKSGYFYCELGYGTEPRGEFMGVKLARPTEPCPKPLTVAQYMHATQHERKVK